MNRRILCLLPYFFILFLIGCSQNVNSIQEKDEYDNIRKIAWEFAKEKGWNTIAKEEWASAEVSEIIANETHELLTKDYQGKEVLVVTFECSEVAVVCPPVILIDPKTNEVIGHIPGE